MGKKIKRRLGTGTRRHASPCILDYGTDTTIGFRRAGGIPAVMGPKWGTSLRTFQDDKFGSEGASAGVMSQVTLDTTDGMINIIGAYWPNKHSAVDTSDQNLWKCLTRYALRHRLVDNTPIQLMQRTTAILYSLYRVILYYYIRRSLTQPLLLRPLLLHLHTHPGSRCPSRSAVATLTAPPMHIALSSLPPAPVSAS